MFFFSMGEMSGPICGSLLTVGLGSFVNGLSVVNLAFIIWAIVTFYHLAGFVILKVKRLEPVKIDELDESLLDEDDSPTLINEKDARKQDQ